jgi:hypothetical protein
MVRNRPVIHVLTAPSLLLFRAHVELLCATTGFQEMEWRDFTTKDSNGVNGEIALDMPRQARLLRSRARGNHEALILTLPPVESGGTPVCAG